MSISWEVEELAAVMTGAKDDDAVEKVINEGTADERLYNKYEVTLEQFEHIVEDLMKFVPKLTSPLTKKQYHALMWNDSAIVKVEAK